MSERKCIFDGTASRSTTILKCRGGERLALIHHHVVTEKSIMLAARRRYSDRFYTSSEIIAAVKCLLNNVPRGSASESKL